MNRATAAPLTSLADLEEAWRHFRRHWRFPEPLEARYAALRDRRHRWPRILFFAVVALAYATAPLINGVLLLPRDDVQALLLWLQLGWGLPTALLAIVAAWAEWPRRLRAAINLVAVLSLWGTVFSLHLMSLLGLMVYPDYLLSTAVMAVGVFGGFRVRRFMIGATGALMLDLLVMLWLLSPLHVQLQAAYQLLLFWAVAVGGALTIDRSHRGAWLSHQRARVLAQTDSLTGLLSRRAFDTHYARVIAQAAREGQPVLLALLDLDHFKRINDTHGHAVGDEVLERTGACLREAGGLRPLDLQARYGGEEFVLLWYGVSPDQAGPLLARLHRAVSPLPFGDGQGGTHEVTASVGAICGCPRAVQEEDALFQQADAVLYRAKHEGRNRALLSVDGEVRSVSPVSQA